MCLHFLERLPVTSNPVIIAHNNKSGAETLTEHFKILSCSEGGKLTSEGQDLYAVNAKGKQEGLFFFQCIEDPEITRILLENSARMRPECDDNGLLAPFAGRGDHCLDHMPVPKMDPVKKTCGYYSHFTHSKS